MRTLTKILLVTSLVFLISTVFASFIAYHYKSSCGKSGVQLSQQPAAAPRREVSEFCKAAQEHLPESKAFGKPGIIAEVDVDKRTITAGFPNASHIKIGKIEGDAIPRKSGTFYITHVDCDFSAVRIHPTWELYKSMEVVVR